MHCDKKSHRGRVQLFAGARTTGTHNVNVLTDAGSPVSRKRMLASSSALRDALAENNSHFWVDFYCNPFKTGSNVRLSVAKSTHNIVVNG